MSTATPTKPSQKALPHIQVSDYVMVSTTTSFIRPFLAVVMSVDLTENQISVRCFRSGRSWDTVWFKGDPRIESRSQLFGEGEDHAVFDLTDKGKHFEALLQRVDATERAMRLLTGKVSELQLEITHRDAMEKKTRTGRSA